MISNFNRHINAEGTQCDLWLEDSENPETIEWLKEQNARTKAELAKGKYFTDARDYALELAGSKDKLIYVAFDGDWAYNFWTDDKNPRGLWRRTSKKNYLRNPKNVEWETLLDIDKLNRDENESWVFKGSYREAKNKNRALLSLSPKGGDAVVIREYDLVAKKFVEDGFHLPVGKNRFSWVDENTLLIAPAYEGSRLTESKYPREVKILKRGQKLSEAKLIFTAEEDDILASPYSLALDSKDERISIVNRAINFYESENFVLGPDLSLSKIPLPNSAEIVGYHKDFGLLFSDRKASKNASKTIAAGSLYALDFKAFLKNPNSKAKITVLFEARPNEILAGTSIGKNGVFVKTLKDVNPKVYLYRKNLLGSAVKDEIPLKAKQTLANVSASDDHPEVFLQLESFVDPKSQWQLKRRAWWQPWKAKYKLTEFQSLPKRFDSNKYQVDQKFVRSKDGTKVPYFIVHKKGLKLDSKNPTILYGYGGFEVNITPSYSALKEKAWLDKGGVYVIANIRGGGEYGPRWHQAALKEYRQKAYNDFIAVAKKLIKDKVTSPRHLGIQGGSNGGLLVAAVMVQRPDLFRAVTCHVPLTDMLRFHKLLVGHSWISEYGDPDIPAEAAYIALYSPYQNLKETGKYPQIFFLTANDDRVHPGHARRMAHKMQRMGHPFYFYENEEGGHGGSADFKQRAISDAMYLNYFWTKLSSD